MAVNINGCNTSTCSKCSCSPCICKVKETRYVKQPTKSALEEAEELIHGPRRDAYGPVDQCFGEAAKVYSVVLAKKLKEPLDAHDVALLGVALKLCREANARSRDNRVDMCGYADLADQLAQIAAEGKK